MEQFISQSDKPLVFDAIPAVKVCHYATDGLPIYTYARLYALKKDIVLDLCSFEREPLENSAIKFYFCKNGTEDQIVVTITPVDFTCEITKDGKKEMVALGALSRFGGVDEQGWYWGGNILIPDEYMKQIGLQIKSGSHFGGAVVKCWLDDEKDQQKAGALGCSSPLSRKEKLAKEQFDQFLVVKY